MNYDGTISPEALSSLIEDYRNVANAICEQVSKLPERERYSEQSREDLRAAASYRNMILALEQEIQRERERTTEGQ